MELVAASVGVSLKPGSTVVVTRAKTATPYLAFHILRSPFMPRLPAFLFSLTWPLLSSHATTLEGTDAQRHCQDRELGERSRLLSGCEQGSSIYITDAASAALPSRFCVPSRAPQGQRTRGLAGPLEVPARQRHHGATSAGAPPRRV